MGLRVDMFAVRRALVDALAGLEVLPLGPAPNTFGAETGTKAAAEQARAVYNDRSNLGVHTSDGWLVFTSGTGTTLAIRSKATYPAPPWGSGTAWIWPRDVQIIYKGSRVRYAGGLVSYSTAWDVIQVLLTGTQLLSTMSGDPVDVTIPGADWGGQYAQGDLYTKLVYRGGSEQQFWDGSAWVTRIPGRLVDADVLPDRGAAMPARRWIKVGAMSSLIEPRVFTGRPVGYSADVDIDLEIGSGPAHTDPDEADQLAYSTLDEVIDVISDIPALPNTGRLTPVATNTIQSWAESDRRETILGLTVRVISR